MGITYFAGSPRSGDPYTFRGTLPHIPYIGPPVSLYPTAAPRTRNSMLGMWPSRVRNCAVLCCWSGRSAPVAFSCTRAFSASRDTSFQRVTAHKFKIDDFRGRYAIRIVYYCRAIGVNILWSNFITAYASKRQ